MNKNSALSILCAVLISTLCNGTETENNFSSHDREILPGGCIYEKQQEITTLERPEMQAMREKLAEYDVLVKEYDGVLAKIHKKISFYFGLPVGALLLCDNLRPKTPDSPFPRISELAVALYISYNVSHYLITNGVSDYMIMNLFGRFFKEWTYKEDLQKIVLEKREECKNAIATLGASLSKNEILMLAKEFGDNKKIRQLFVGILLTK